MPSHCGTRRCSAKVTLVRFTWKAQPRSWVRPSSQTKRNFANYWQPSKRNTAWSPSSTRASKRPSLSTYRSGVKEIAEAGDNLAIISAPYTRNDLVQGSLGVLGPTRMHYERAMTAVAYVAQLFSEALSKM